MCGECLFTGSKFCSLECKSKSQIRRIKFDCFGCNKTFLNLPYLKRKTNYCSTNCYWSSTRRTEIRKCKVCGKDFEATATLIKNGFGIYCSRECLHKTYPQKVEKKCIRCNVSFFVWPSHAPKNKFCSKKCADDQMRDYVHRACKRCKGDFQLPRSDLNRGRGTFCTWRCFIRYKGPSSLEEKVMKILDRANIKYRREVKFQRFHVDFLIEGKKLVIECDGEYWHMNPIVRERDKRKNKILGKLGYKILRLSGKEIIRLTEKELVSKMQF